MNKNEFYRQVNMQVRALCQDEPNLIANLSNISAILYESMDRVNWAGFYMIAENLQKDGEELVLGPFQGRPACVRIPLGRGVCGTAAATNQVMLVKDVHEFDGHIACDAASNSEIVLPIVIKERVVAVLDIDSPELARFDSEDAEGLGELVNFIESVWPEQV